MIEKEVKNSTAVVRIIAFLVFSFVIFFTLILKPKRSPAEEQYSRDLKTLHTYGGKRADSGWNVVNAGDGYMAVGDTASYGQGSNNAYLIKTDLDGNLVWTRTFGGNGAQSGIGLCAANDNGFVIAGGSTSGGSGQADGYLVKTDKDGEQAWENYYGGDNYDYFYSVCKAVDKGYAAVGYTSSFGAGLNSDVYLVKTDDKGNKLWQKTYGGPGWDIGYSIIQSGEGGYMIAGYTTSYGAGKSDMYVIKTDADGNCVWARTYGGGREDRAVSIIQAEGGGYIIEGKSQSYVSRGFGWDLVLMKIDPLGKELWTRVYPAAEAEIGNCIAKASGGGYIAVGTKKCYGICDTNIYVIRTDAEGNSKWVRIFSGKSDEFANSVCRAQGTGYIVLGTTLSFGQGNGDIFMMKISEDGEIVW
jgi:hypothetical protein